MEKISGILPSSRRVASVDLNNAKPVRPGMPTFGAPQGVAALGQADRFSRSSFSSTPDFTPGYSGWKARDLNRAGQVDQIANSFFSRNDQAAEEVAPDQAVSAEVLSQIAPEAVKTSVTTDSDYTAPFDPLAELAAQIEYAAEGMEGGEEVVAEVAAEAPVDSVPVEIPPAYAEESAPTNGEEPESAGLDVYA